MISVQELREQLLREANQHGFPVITYDTVDWIIERLAATRDGMYDLGDAGRDEGQDPEVEILDLTNIAEPADGIAAQSQGEPSTVEREVNAIIKKVADMDI
ncbi:hypothetical protein RhiJN_13556 [Ceratobasidium sp. AG-Ba]|nr:hypothetical protein RhiJN_13556 [Ceratobasidium sp. AG-Ba]